VKASELKSPEPKRPDVKAPEPKAPDLQTPLPKTLDAKATVPAAPIPKAGPTKVDELLELSGLRVQLAGLLGRVALDLRPPPGQMSAADMATIDRILARSLQPEAVYGAVRDTFRPLVDRPNLEAAAAWLRTPVARKIVALEVASSEPSAEPKVAEYAATIKANPPPARRLEACRPPSQRPGLRKTGCDPGRSKTERRRSALGHKNPCVRCARCRCSIRIRHSKTTSSRST